jgi:hypothetical protein
VQTTGKDLGKKEGISERSYTLWMTTVIFQRRAIWNKEKLLHCL